MRPDAVWCGRPKGWKRKPGVCYRTCPRGVRRSNSAGGYLWPNVCKELAAGLPTAISLASTDQTLLMIFSSCCTAAKVSAFTVTRFHWRAAWRRGEKRHCHWCGMSDGIGFGANARTALITRGLLKCRVLARRWVPILPPLWACGAGGSGAYLYRQPVA